MYLKDILKWRGTSMQIESCEIAVENILIKI